MSPDYPRTWSDMSFEFKGMFGYHISMMVMMLAGRSLAFIEQIAIAGAIAMLVAVASVIRRIRHNWHWKGLTPMRAAGAVLMVVLLGYFVFASAGGALQAQGLALDRPVAVGAWVLAAFGLGLFMVLNILRITHLSEKVFREECGDQALQPQPEVPPEPRWKVITKFVFMAAFLAVWLEAVTFFYVNDRALRAASPTPTVERSAPMNNRGKTVYVTPAEKRLIDQLQGFMFIGIPAAIATAFFLQFVLKVRFDFLR